MRTEIDKLNMKIAKMEAIISIIEKALLHIEKVKVDYSIEFFNSEENSHGKSSCVIYLDQGQTFSKKDVDTIVTKARVLYKADEYVIDVEDSDSVDTENFLELLKSFGYDTYTHDVLSVIC
jgi:hypothetical protein